MPASGLWWRGAPDLRDGGGDRGHKKRKDRALQNLSERGRSESGGKKVSLGMDGWVGGCRKTYIHGSQKLNVDGRSRCRNVKVWKSLVKCRGSVRESKM